MWSAKFVVWVCSLVGLSCGVTVPDVSIIQSAYEREASNGDKRHDKGLRVVKSDCDDLAGNQFVCQLVYLSSDDPAQQLYFDVVTVARGAAGWELKGGLCKR